MLCYLTGRDLQRTLLIGDQNMVEIEFNKEEFLATFPHVDLTCYTVSQVAFYWELAKNYMAGCYDALPYEPEKGVFDRAIALNLAFAHLIQMHNNHLNGGLAGRITSASEGGVSVSVETYKADTMTAQWWSQTEEGRQYWMFTAGCRLGGRFYSRQEIHPWG